MKKQRFNKEDKIMNENREERSRIKAMFVFEDDGDGQHFIIINGKKSYTETYEYLSHLETEEGWFIGATKYYDGVLPTECVLKVTIA